MDKQLIAAWESKSGKYWLQLFRDELGYNYVASGGCGNYGADMTDEEALKRAEVTARFFQPDNLKTPMRRVK